MEDRVNENTNSGIKNGEFSPKKENSDKNLPIPDISIMRLNYWVEDSDIYDQTVLKAFRNQYEAYEETKNEDDKLPKDLLLCSGYEIDKRNILE